MLGRRFFAGALLFLFASRSLALQSPSLTGAEMPQGQTLPPGVMAAILAALGNMERIQAIPFSPPSGNTTKNLFIPAMHRCDEEKYKDFLKKHPGQAARTANQIAIEKSLGIVHDVLAHVGLPTILSSGSLLGFIRNCGVIPTDADGDVAVLGHWLKGNCSLKKLTAAFEQRNATLHSGMCPKGPLVTGCELRATFEDNSYVDIFVWATEKRCPKAPCNFFSPLWPGGSVGPSFYKCDTRDVHFEQAYFLNKIFWIPSPPQRYLKEMYGPGWHEPGGGVYKTCNLKYKVKPAPDVFADLTPPPEYVLSLERAGAALAAQVKSAVPFED
eukprot:TRINITY_DN15207_c0_g1_i8.p1 TRINITY_DN15207_c0_g1~~TRINITY_DN15207_c0_g1_i8.p1  ORF type:complete len:328 (-),score=55.28 TRINITY_DN15207_c0_g1_i8:116-1099(-)